MYVLSEREILEKIRNCEEGNIAECFEKWANANKIKESDEFPKDVYFVCLEKVKIRYINPLVKLQEKKAVRVSEISEKVKLDIEKVLQFKTKKYAYLDFKFA